MNIKTTIGLIVGFVVVILVFMSFYTVTQGEQALKLKLGELTRNSGGQVMIYNPGLHFQVPLVTKVHHFNVRLQTLKVDQSRILTAEQKYVLVDYYAKWRISNLALYYTRTGGRPYRAQQLLKQKINDALRAAFGRRTIKEVVSGERLNIMMMLKKKANESAKGLGIHVVDVRIQGIELPQAVRDSVYQRMSAQREQVATQHRTQGQAAAEALRADADANMVITIAQAQLDAQKIRAKGDREAAEIYAKAYSKNPSFYAFYRSLEAYQQVFSNKGSVLVLKPDSQFFKYFNKANGIHRAKRES